MANRVFFQWDAIDQAPRRSVEIRGSHSTSPVDATPLPRAESPRKPVPATGEHHASFDISCADALVREVSTEFLEQIESTRIKYEAEIETLKGELQKLVEDKAARVEERNRADADASRARTEAMEVIYLHMYNIAHAKNPLDNPDKNFPLPCADGVLPHRATAEEQRK